MKRALNFLMRHGWSLYLGGALVYLDFPVNTAQFWAVFIPTVILVNLSHVVFLNEEKE